MNHIAQIRSLQILHAKYYCMILVCIVHCSTYDMYVHTYNNVTYNPFHPNSISRGDGQTQQATPHGIFLQS